MRFRRIFSSVLPTSCLILLQLNRLSTWIFFFLIFIFPKLVFEKTIFIYFVVYPKVSFLGCDVQIISKMLE